ncbi:hypothetical protein CGRA01v4_02568 [Colletotrichum graminicola]|nr:hypothetical protein CGRA01v4_02568 [Colletotrichum graminicola]
MHPFNQSHMYFTNEGILTIYPPIDPHLVPPTYIDEELLVASNQPTAVTELSKEYQSPSVDFPSADYWEPLTQPRHRLRSHPEHLQVRHGNSLPQFSPPPQVVLFNDFQFPGYEQMNLHNTASLLVRDILMSSEIRLRVKAAQQRVRLTEQSGSNTGVWSGFLAAPQHYHSQQHGCEDLQPQVAGMSNMALLGDQPREPIQFAEMGKHYRSQSGQRMQSQSRLHCGLKKPFSATRQGYRE